MGARKDILPGDTLGELVTHFGLRSEQLKELEAFENFVFEYSSPDGPGILRVTQAHHRSVEEIQAELDWVRFLTDRGVTIATPIPAQDGRELVVSRDEKYMALAWQKVPGVSLVGEEVEHLWCPALYQEWGRTLGCMHRLSEEYVEPPGRPTRWSWSEDRYVRDWQTDVGPDHPQATASWLSTLESLKRLPKNFANYGIIHADLHAKNFFWDEGRLQIFDTDDCQYNWFAADLASVLTSVSLSERAQPQTEDFVEDFRQHFMRGYKLEFELSPEELEHLPLFRRFRELLIFGALCNRWDFDSLSVAQEKLVSRLRQRIMTTPVES